ncbi:MAG: hypothetical protein US99_C0009G0004 [Candidatus Daviesbacteria bacterium GW2011_GWF2_38_6]|uniref:Uncharacterized protein n=1 Tax=Candidatus Daviesbacteria bacterium GW2011_GWF2_38_6 TaxID=1618432 RepID=A0A0G0KGU3_9BACT|nr:MAG: hypothetical protein US99_C0009G0004 [Candidatus Daviesbacteria bacterium GW2011_GWF2_38_6]
MNVGEFKELSDRLKDITKMLHMILSKDKDHKCKFCIKYLQDGALV